MFALLAKSHFLTIPPVQKIFSPGTSTRPFKIFRPRGEVKDLPREERFLACLFIIAVHRQQSFRSGQPGHESDPRLSRLARGQFSRLSKVPLQVPVYLLCVRPNPWCICSVPMTQFCQLKSSSDFAGPACRGHTGLEVKCLGGHFTQTPYLLCVDTGGSVCISLGRLIAPGPRLISPGPTHAILVPLLPELQCGTQISSRIRCLTHRLIFRAFLS